MITQHFKIDLHNKKETCSIFCKIQGSDYLDIKKQLTKFIKQAERDQKMKIIEAHSIP